MFFFIFSFNKIRAMIIGNLAVDAFQFTRHLKSEMKTDLIKGLFLIFFPIRTRVVSNARADVVHKMKRIEADCDGH